MTQLKLEKQRGLEFYKTNAIETQDEQLLIFQYGYKIIALRNILEKFIAQNFYFYEVTEKTYKLLSRLYQLDDREEIETMIEALADAEVFDSEIYNNYHILVSANVQDSAKETIRTRVISKRRRYPEYKQPLYKELWIVPLTSYEKYIEFISCKDEGSRTVLEEFGREEKKSIEKKSIEKKSIEKISIEETSPQVIHSPMTVAEVDDRQLSDKADINKHTLIAITKTHEEYFSNKQNLLDIVLFYFKAYEYKFNKPIKEYTQDDFIEIVEQLITPVADEFGDVKVDVTDVNTYKEMIVRYFNSEMNCDYDIKHFLSGKIRLNRVNDIENFSY